MPRISCMQNIHLNPCTFSPVPILYFFLSKCMCKLSKAEKVPIDLIAISVGLFVLVVNMFPKTSLKSFQKGEGKCKNAIKLWKCHQRPSKQERIAKALIINFKVKRNWYGLILMHEGLSSRYQIWPIKYSKWSLRCHFTCHNNEDITNICIYLKEQYRKIINFLINLNITQWNLKVKGNKKIYKVGGQTVWPSWPALSLRTFLNINLRMWRLT